MLQMLSSWLISIVPVDDEHNPEKPGAGNKKQPKGPPRVCYYCAQQNCHLMKCQLLMGFVNRFSFRFEKSLGLLIVLFWV